MTAPVAASGPPWPPLDALDIADDDAYTWLLSAHPWAVAERARRRHAHHARELAEAADVLAAADRLRSAGLDADHPLAGLPDRVDPLARRAALVADVDAAEADDTATAEARRRWETTRRASGDLDYRYPPELADPATAAGYPPPLPEDPRP